MNRTFCPFLVAILLMWSQTAIADKQDPVKIGGLFVLTGQYAMQGAAFREGAELAVAEINSKGGVAGRNLELHIEDTANLASQALKAARKLLEMDRVVAALTTSYPELSTGAAEFQRQKIPVIHLWDASPEIDSMGEYIFGIGPWTPSSGEVSARFALKQIRAKTAVIMHIHDPWSELVSRYFRDEFIKGGGRVLETFAFNPQDSDFRTLFAKMRAVRPEVIYSPITDNIIPFYRQLKQANLGMPIVSSDVIADEHIHQDASSFEGLYQSQMRDPTGPPMERLAVSYRSKFGRPLTLPWFVATAYDGVKLIAHCVEVAGPTSALIHGCITKTKGLPGVSQLLTFTAGGSSPQIASIYKIQDGKLVFVWADDESPRI